MKSYLKTGEFVLPDGESLSLVELSAGGRRALFEHSKEMRGDPFVLSALAVKYGCPELRDKTPETILDDLPAELLNEIASAVLKLSGISVGDEAQAEKN